MSKQEKLQERVTAIHEDVLHLAADAIDFAVDQLKPVRKHGRKIAGDLRAKAFNL